MQSTIDTEALIIGAGPIGLFQAFELGLLGINCHIVESMNKPGGQCIELYPEKPIYDIPGTAYTSAADFVEQLLLQLKPFNTPIHTLQTVVNIEKAANGFVASTDKGTVFKAQKIFIATGAGAFTAVKLRVEGIGQFENTQLHYNAYDPTLIAGKNVVVIGDNNDAVHHAISAQHTAASVVFLHRKRRLDTSAENLSTLEQLVNDKKITQIKGKIVSYQGGTALSKLTIKAADTTLQIDADQLLVFLGNSPKQSDLDSWGIETTARHVPVDTANYESKLSGIFAVGDINTYPAKRKLILCGFHEATMAAFAATAALRPDKPLHLQYTTTSTELLKRLGVS